MFKNQSEGVAVEGLVMFEQVYIPWYQNSISNIWNLLLPK